MRSQVVAALVAALIVGAASTTAVAGPVPTPTGSPPAPPSDPELAGGVVTWADNSDNEDGFRITFEIRGDLNAGVTVLEYEVGPNVTSLPQPPETVARCPDRTSLSIRVTAFNAFGETESLTGFVLSLLCAAPTSTSTSAPLATATSAPTILPQTGGGDSTGDTRSIILPLLAAGGSLIALGAVWYVRRRSSP